MFCMPGVGLGLQGGCDNLEPSFVIGRVVGKRNRFFEIISKAVDNGTR